MTSDNHINDAIASLKTAIQHVQGAPILQQTGRADPRVAVLLRTLRHLDAIAADLALVAASSAEAK